MEGITQMSFEFNQWEECFKVWRDNLPIYGDNMQLVVSHHWASSGYWIEEKGKETTPSDIVYTGDNVFKLEDRIKKEIALSEQENRSPKFIT